jgi:peptidoglycan/LPS O-acetylase OafA/YrhL
MPAGLAVILSAPVFRLASSLAWPANYVARIWLPFACPDTLGAGAFLALIADETGPYAGWRRPCTRLGLVVGGPLFLLGLGLFFLNKFPRGIDTVFLPSAMGLFFLWVIDRATGFPGAFGRLLACRPMVYLGTISYGRYVLHFFMVDMVSWGWARLGLPAPLLGVSLHFALSAVATVLLASVSCYILEKPLNELKRYFPYAPAPAARAAVAPAAAAGGA